MLTAITATSIMDATGTLLASGTLSFQAVNSPIRYTITRPIVNGMVSGLRVPTGYNYQIVVMNPSGQPVLTYHDVLVTGTTWDFDTYTPSY
jgi:hypothetical protein